MKPTRSILPMIFAVAAAMPSIAAAQPLDQIGSTAPEDRSRAGQIDASPQPRASSTIEQAAAPSGGSAADQLTIERRATEPAPQLAPQERRRGGQQTQQLHALRRTAEPSEALSSRSAGRDSKVTPVGGSDRCDPGAAPPKRDRLCARVIETRASEFAAPGPPALTPEQRLLAEQPRLDTRSINVATRRLGEDGEPLSASEEAVAAAASRGRLNANGTAQSEGERATAAAVAEAIANPQPPSR